MVLTVNLAIDPGAPRECSLYHMVCEALWLHKEESDTQRSLVFRKISALWPFWEELLKPPLREDSRDWERWSRRERKELQCPLGPGGLRDGGGDSIIFLSKGVG